MDQKITLNQIRTVVTEAVEEVVERKLEQKLEQKLDEKLKKELAPIHKTLKKIQKDLLVSFNFADKQILNHENRIRKVESALNIPRPF